jgi:hypothetical protein
MERRKFTREFKLASDQGTGRVQAAQDLGVHPTQLGNWVKAFADVRSMRRVFIYSDTQLIDDDILSPIVGRQHLSDRMS